MNQELFDNALLTLNRVLDPITIEVIEEHVEDAVEVRGELTNFSDDWYDDTVPVINALCNYFNIEEVA